MDASQLTDAYLDLEFANADTSIFRDLSLNFKKQLSEGALEPQERFMNLLAAATALGNKPMAELARSALTELGVEGSHIRESAEVAGLMGMNNIYYKFRNYVGEGLTAEHYNRAGLRMQSMMKPHVGKHAFEMLSLTVSIINGCPVCVSSHEKSLRELSVAPEKIHDAIRLAACAKGLDSLKTAREFMA